MRKDKCCLYERFLHFSLFLAKSDNEVDSDKSAGVGRMREKTCKETKSEQSHHKQREIIDEKGKYQFKITGILAKKKGTLK